MRDLQVTFCPLVQEWWGVTDDLKEIAVDISKRSYRALIPDLYKGKVGVEVEEAKHVRAGMRCNVCTAMSALLLRPAHALLYHGAYHHYPPRLVSHMSRSSLHV